MKKMITGACLVVLALAALAACGLHFYKLGQVPYGFHVDEMSGAVAVGCMATEGVDAHNVPHPLFADMHYGTPKPPTWLYPAMLWAKGFGFSVGSLRALSVTAHLIGILGLLFLARSLFGWRCAILTVTVASLSPWAWVPSRVAFESLFSATFLIWGLYVFLKPPSYGRMALAGILLAGAMYSYPPLRLQVPLMVLPLVLYARWRNPLSWKRLAVFGVSFVLPLIPLVQKTLNGDLQQRFNAISIFSHSYLKSVGATGNWKDLTEIFFHNYFLHFTPDFLFWRGDPSYVHSTRHFGIFSWMDMLALAVGVVFLLMLLVPGNRKHNPWRLYQYVAVFLVVNIFIGFIPVALTNSELPNSLRIIGAWPFACLLSGFLLWQACERFWLLWPVVVITTLLFAGVFLRVYFQVYPQEGKGMFNYWTLEQANRIKTDEDWMKFMLRYRYDDYHCRYFLMQYRHLSCTQSRVQWEGLRDFMLKRGIYY